MNLENKYTDICFDPAITNETYLKDCLVEMGYTVTIAEDNKELTVYINGMKCKSCVNKITTALSAKNGVLSVNVSIKASFFF